MNDIFNPAPTAPVATHSEAFNLPRFSNYGEDALPSYQQMSGNVSSGTGIGTNTSGSGVFNWSYVGDWLNSAANIVTGIWGTSDKYMSNAYQTMYNQERKTSNLLIGIVVAIVLLAFVFLIVKKK